MDRRSFRLDLTLCLGGSLFEGQGLLRIEELLQSEAGRWASGLHIWKEGEKNPRRDIASFEADVQHAAIETGSLFKAMVQKHGPDPFMRRTGSVELRGADRALSVIVVLDDYRFAPSAGCWLWGNTVTFEVIGGLGEGGDTASFVRTLTRAACKKLKPYYARAHLPDEWERKNLSSEGGSVMAVGVDASRYLPGLYWLNFFGEPYCSLMGRQHLLEAPAAEVERVADGVLLCIADRPEAWNTPEYMSAEQRILAHIGEQYFFKPNAPNRKTVAPDFGLSALPRNPRFT